MVLRPLNATDADSLVQHAEELYAWGAARQGEGGWGKIKIDR
jgi:hypothetical protein